MILFIIFYTFPSYDCESSSLGRIGYLSHLSEPNKKNPTYINDISSLYLRLDKIYVTNWAVGSICPKTPGSITLKAYGNPAIYASFNKETLRENEGTMCAGDRTMEWTTEYLFANRCYPIAMASYTNCGDTFIQGYINNQILYSTCQGL